jgi:hypothetical protein
MSSHLDRNLPVGTTAIGRARRSLHPTIATHRHGDPEASPRHAINLRAAQV